MKQWSSAGLKSPFTVGDRDGFGLALAPCGISVELMGETPLGCSVCKGGTVPSTSRCCGQ